jgi:endonuclease YncB( thermonuclease family)
VPPKITDDLALYKRVVTILKWRDGDTADVQVDNGFNHAIFTALRLRGVNTPELDQLGGEEAKAFSEGACPVGSQWKVQFYRRKSGRYEQSFDRYVGVLFLDTGKTLNGVLLDTGLGVIDDPSQY